MRWLLGSRQVAAPALVTAIMTGVLILTLDVRLPVPSLVGNAAGIPAALLICAGIASLVLATLAKGNPCMETTAVRRIANYEFGLAFGLTCVCLIPLALGAMAKKPTEVPIRNLLGFMAVGLVARYFVGRQAASFAPVALMVLVAVLGKQTNEILAWPLASGGSGASAATVLALSAVGLALGFVRQRGWPLQAQG